MSFPDIPLEPINAIASRLFAKDSGASTEEAQKFQTDLQAKLLEIDTAITSIKGQLATRLDDPRWAKAAKRAQAHYTRQREAIFGFLKTTRILLETLQAHNSRVTKTANRKKHEEEIAAADARRRLRIELATSKQEVWWNAFKEVCREQLGEEQYKTLVGLAVDRINKA